MAATASALFGKLARARAKAARDKARRGAAAQATQRPAPPPWWSILDWKAAPLGLLQEMVAEERRQKQLHLGPGPFAMSYGAIPADLLRRLVAEVRLQKAVAEGREAPEGQAGGVAGPEIEGAAAGAAEAAPDRGIDRIVVTPPPAFRPRPTGRRPR
jgi:hypothetical protein